MFFNLEFNLKLNFGIFRMFMAKRVFVSSTMRKKFKRIKSKCVPKFPHKIKCIFNHNFNFHLCPNAYLDWRTEFSGKDLIFILDFRGWSYVWIWSGSLLCKTNFRAWKGLKDLLNWLWVVHLVHAFLSFHPSNYAHTLLTDFLLLSTSSNWSF